METEQGLVDDHPEDAEGAEQAPEQPPAVDAGADEEGVGEEVKNDEVGEPEAE